MASSNPLSIDQLEQLATPAKTNYFDPTLQNPVKEKRVDSEGRSWWAVMFGPLYRLFHAVQQHRQERETCLYLLSLDDCHLDDIGINRADVVWAMRQHNPLLSATAELNKLVHGDRRSGPSPKK